MLTDHNPWPLPEQLLFALGLLLLVVIGLRWCCQEHQRINQRQREWGEREEAERTEGRNAWSRLMYWDCDNCYFHALEWYDQPEGYEHHCFERETTPPESRCDQWRGWEEGDGAQS